MKPESLCDVNSDLSAAQFSQSHGEPFLPLLLFIQRKRLPEAKFALIAFGE